MKKIILFILVISFPCVGFAETIVLKSGATIDEKIVERGDDFIQVEASGSSITYYLDQIESIDGEMIELQDEIIVQEEDSPVIEVVPEIQAETEVEVYAPIYKSQDGSDQVPSDEKVMRRGSYVDPGAGEDDFMKSMQKFRDEMEKEKQEEEKRRQALIEKLRKFPEGDTPLDEEELKTMRIFPLKQLVRDKIDWVKQLEQEQIDAAKGYQKAKEYQKVIDIYTGLVDKYPYISSFYLSRSFVLTDAGQYDKAVEDLLQYNSLAGGIAGWLLIGDVYKKKQDYDLAEEYYTKEIDYYSARPANNPSHRVLIARSIIYSRQKQYQKALDDLFQALPYLTSAYEAATGAGKRNWKEDLADLHMRLAYVYKKLNDEEGFKDYLKKAEDLGANIDYLLHYDERTILIDIYEE